MIELKVGNYYKWQNHKGGYQIFKLIAIKDKNCRLCVIKDMINESFGFKTNPGYTFDYAIEQLQDNDHWSLDKEYMAKKEFNEDLNDLLKF